MGETLLTAGLSCGAVLGVWALLEVSGVRVHLFADRRRPLALLVVTAALLAGWFILERREQAARDRSPAPNAKLLAEAEPEAMPASRSATPRYRPPGPAEGYLFLGTKTAGESGPEAYASSGALTINHVPVPGYTVRTRTAVYLHADVPDSTAPLVLTEALSLVPAGTRLQVGSITRIDPGGYYWAGVTVLSGGRAR